MKTKITFMKFTRKEVVEYAEKTMWTMDVVTLASIIRNQTYVVGVIVDQDIVLHGKNILKTIKIK